MNAITRALLEHELEDIQECHARAVDQIDDLRERLKKAEEARDEYVEQIGALKEDLALADVEAASQRIQRSVYHAFF